MFVKLLFAICIFNVNTVVLQPSESSLLKSARNAYNSGDFALAKEKYTELLSLNPNSLDYNFEAGLSYISSEIEKEKALTYFEKAMRSIKRQ
jgi:tetratricopeptide (TPR) repeat protein